MTKTHCWSFIDISGHKEDFVVNEKQHKNLIQKINSDNLINVGKVFINMKNISFVLVNKSTCCDCGALYGERHSVYCDRVICKECYNQALSCDC